MTVGGLSVSQELQARAPRRGMALLRALALQVGLAILI
jgi:hypothetical protein